MVQQSNWLFIIALIGFSAGVLKNGPEYILKRTINCDGLSYYKQVVFTSPSQKNNCKYLIRAHSLFVCQLRIDFSIEFIAQTSVSDSSELECNHDYFEVGGMKFCGKENQQHIYLPFNRNAGQKEIEMRINIANRSRNKALPPAMYGIKVTQLDCSLGFPLRSSIPNPAMTRTFFNDGFWIAPTGCLQYFPDQKGVVESFNYDSGNGSYPGNRNYAICFRRNANTQLLQLTIDYFKIPPYSERQFDGNCRSQIMMPVGVSEYLSIPEAEVLGTWIRASLFCGIIPSGTIIQSKYFGPLVLGFHSDSKTEAVAEKKGFRLSYKVL